MLLAIDVGNTETKLGCFDGKGDLIHTWRITTDAKRTADEIGGTLAQLFATTGTIALRDVDAVAVASVVPQLDAVLEECTQRYCRVSPVFLKAQKQSVIPVRTERAGELGADLVAAAIGARERYGAPAIVVSYGTATVFMAISPQGEFLGTAIAPGISISVDALVGRTAKLPQIALQAPGSAIGRETISSLQAGIVYGFVGQTEALVNRMREELGSHATVIATGGLADVVARHTALVDRVDPHLSLLGLKIFHGKTSER